MKTSAATNPPAPPRFVRRGTLLALRDIGDLSVGAMCGTMAVWFLGDTKNAVGFRDVMGLMSAVFFLIAAAILFKGRFRRRTPAEIAGDNELVEAPSAKTVREEYVRFAGLSTALAIWAIFLTSTALASGRSGAAWWQWPPLFNTFAVIVANCAGWGACPGWGAPCLITPAKNAPPPYPR